MSFITYKIYVQNVYYIQLLFIFTKLLIYIDIKLLVYRTPLINRYIVNWIDNNILYSVYFSNRL